MYEAQLACVRKLLSRNADFSTTSLKIGSPRLAGNDGFPMMGYRGEGTECLSAYLSSSSYRRVIQYLRGTAVSHHGRPCIRRGQILVSMSTHCLRPMCLFQSIIRQVAGLIVEAGVRYR